MKKILPITRSFAELTRNRSNKDVTLRGIDSMTSASADAKVIHGGNFFSSSDIQGRKITISVS